MRCNITLDLLITKSACLLTGNYRNVDLLTSDRDRNNCIRNYIKARNCKITLFNYADYRRLYPP